MNVRLREADARAVDLILDRAASSAQGNGGNGNGALYAASHTGVTNEQVSAVEKMLKLLDLMPAAEPPQDLLQRTLERVGAHTDAPMRGGISPSLIDTSRPHA